MKWRKFSPTNNFPRQIILVPLLLKFKCDEKWVLDAMEEFVNNFYLYDFAGNLVDDKDEDDESEIEFDIAISKISFYFYAIFIAYTYIWLHLSVQVVYILFMSLLWKYECAVHFPPEALDERLRYNREVMY